MDVLWIVDDLGFLLPRSAPPEQPRRKVDQSVVLVDENDVLDEHNGVLADQDVGLFSQNDVLSTRTALWSLRTSFWGRNGTNMACKYTAFLTYKTSHELYVK